MSDPSPLFPERDWRPLPRPAAEETPVPIRRADPPHAAIRRPGALSEPPGGEGPEVLSLGTEEAVVRFRHHAPRARTVALQANGWWRVVPADACDLRPIGEGWWEGVFVVPAGWRATYGFVEHDGAGDPPWWRTGLKSPGAPVTHDVSNPRRHAAARGGAVRSVISLPDDGPFGHSGLGHGDAGGARPEISLDPPVHTLLDPSRPGAGAPTGDGSPAPVTRWWASQPGDPGCEGLGARDPLPLLIVLDGFEHVDRLGTPALLRRAVAEGALPPLAAVFVESGPHRAEVLGVPGGHARWIAADLLPHLRRHGLGNRTAEGHEGDVVPVTADPAGTVITGSSFGGLSALFAIAQAPDLIGAAIAQSVSLWRYPEGALPGPLRQALAGRGARLRLHAGLFEGDMPERARALAEDLRTAGLDVRLAVHPGGHDWAWWQPAALHELAALLGP